MYVGPDTACTVDGELILEQRQEGIRVGARRRVFGSLHVWRLLPLPFLSDSKWRASRINVFFLLFGLGLPLLFHTMKLVVEVTDDFLSIRYVPFVNRTIPWVDISSCEARTYQAIREHGGWGIRGLWGKSQAYTVSGNQGVDLELQSGQHIMIGSQKAGELALAIETKLPGYRCT